MRKPLAEEPGKKRRRSRKRRKSSADSEDDAKTADASDSEDAPPNKRDNRGPSDGECAEDGARPGTVAAVEDRDEEEEGGDPGRGSKKRKRKRGRKRRSSDEVDGGNTEGDSGAPGEKSFASDNEDAPPSMCDDRRLSNGEGIEDGARPAKHGTAATAEDRNEGKEGGDPAKEPKKRKRKRNRKRRSGGEPDGGYAEGGPSAHGCGDAKLHSGEYTVFVEGLPFHSTEDEVRAFFTSRGCGDILQLRLPTWQDTGRLRGFGHVVFASEEARSRALSDEVNGKDLGGRYVAVKEANDPRAGTTAGAALGGSARPQPEGCRRVFVRNLPYGATEEQIAEAFRACGKITEDGVRVVRRDGRSKGFGYVDFKREEGAYAAVQRAAKPFGVVVAKRPVFVDYDEGTVRGSFRDREGRLWSKGRSNSGFSGRGRGGGRGRRARGPGLGIQGVR